MKSARLALLFAIFFALPVLPQQLANFTLRGTLASTQINPFTGMQEGYLHLSSEANAYVVTCQDQACADFLVVSLGQRIGTTGQAHPILVLPPRTQEIFAVNTIGPARNERSTFLFRGILTGYVAPHVSVSGLPEFELTVAGEVHHLVCDPLYVGCNTVVQLNLGNCVAPTGDMESAGTGFIGDTVTYLWTTHIYTTNQSCE